MQPSEAIINFSEQVSMQGLEVDRWLIDLPVDPPEPTRALFACSCVDLLASRDAAIVSASAEVISTEGTGIHLGNCQPNVGCSLFC
jgi:hypothetical protein